MPSDLNADIEDGEIFILPVLPLERADTNAEKQDVNECTASFCAPNGDVWEHEFSQPKPWKESERRFCGPPFVTDEEYAIFNNEKDEEDDIDDCAADDEAIQAKCKEIEPTKCYVKDNYFNCWRSLPDHTRKLSVDQSSNGPTPDTPPKSKIEQRPNTPRPLSLHGHVGSCSKKEGGYIAVASKKLSESSIGDSTFCTECEFPDTYKSSPFQKVVWKRGKKTKFTRSKKAAPYNKEIKVHEEKKDQRPRKRLNLSGRA